MHRIVTAVGLLVLMSLPVLAQKEFEPTAAERQTIDDCIDNAAGDSELKQMSQCIGLIADPCVDEPGANTFTIVACNMREQKIWDEKLNDWYGQARSHLKDNAGTAAALKDAQRAWIEFRDTSCGYWEKRYEGGTFASVATGNCTRIKTGRRALEMRAIFEDPRSLVDACLVGLTAASDSFRTALWWLSLVLAVLDAVRSPHLC